MILAFFGRYLNLNAEMPSDGGWPCLVFPDEGQVCSACLLPAGNYYGFSKLP